MKGFISRIREYIKKTEPSLAEIVKKEKKTNKNIKKILTQKNQAIRIPSRNSFLKVFLIIGFLGLLAHFDFIHGLFIQVIHQFNNICDNSFIYSLELLINNVSQYLYYLDFEKNDHFSNLITIHAGIGAVLIGLAFFVAQSLTDKNDHDKGRVLLYKSHFFPLLTAEILIFFMFIRGYINFFALVAIIALAFFTIYFLGGTINILIKDYEMEKAKKKMFFAVLKRNFIKILDQEITKRIGGNYLHKKGEIIEKETNGLVRLTPFGFYDDSSKYISINADKLGVVTDISFKELKKLIAEIKNIASKNKKYNFNTPETTEQSTPISRQETIACIRTQFLGYTSEIYNELIQIREDLFDEDYKTKDLEHLKKIISKVFTIQELPEVEKEAHLEISKVKDRCIKAINKQETGELAKIVDFYIELLKEFFAYINLYGGGFSSEQAEKERNSFFGQIKPIEWLSDDIREIFEKGIQSDDLNVIREVAYLPIRLANEAIEHKDHLIFQEFIYFPQLLYSCAYDRKGVNPKISQLMFDRTWRYLRELSDYHLESKLKKNTGDEENFIDFAIHLLKVFQGLIKASFDNRDFENYKTFVSKASILFRHLATPYFHNEDKNVFDKIDAKRQEMFLGIASWTLYKTEIEEGNGIAKKYFDEISCKLETDIERLTKTFLSTHNREVYRFRWWTRRELDEKDEDSEFAHSIHIREKLEKLYVVQSLKILQSKSDTQIEEIELPHTRELAFLAEEKKGLIKILNDIKSNDEKWEFVLSEQQIAKVDKFKELLEKARKAQEEKDSQRKRDAKVSEKKINEFKENVIKDFYESRGIRGILDHHKLIIDKSMQPYQGHIKKRGVNTMFDKVPFFDKSVQWHVHFMDRDNGFGFGKSLVNGENNKIVKKIQDNLTLVSRLNFDKELTKLDPRDTIIISVNRGSWKFFEYEKNKNYNPEWQLDKKKKSQYAKELAGIYSFQDQEIPVYDIFNHNDSKQILILNVNNIGKIIQYSPLEKGEPKEFQKDIFYMDIGTFTENSDLLEEFLNKPPDWLKEVGEQEDQKNHLKERVVIKIFEKFEFKLADTVWGFKINVEE